MSNFKLHTSKKQMDMTNNHFGPRSRISAWAAFIAAAVAAIGLAGCVNYAGIHSDAHIDPPAQFETKQSLPDEGGKWPAMDWAKQFGDPQLPALIDEALKGNPSIEQAKARIEKATSYVGTSKSALYPNVSGSYSWTRQRYSENGIVPPPYAGTWQSENTVLAGASWDLDLWGKNRERLRQAISRRRSLMPRPSRSASRWPRRWRARTTISPSFTRCAISRRAR
jgi:hypothetical protein